MITAAGLMPDAREIYCSTRMFLLDKQLHHGRCYIATADPIYDEDGKLVAFAHTFNVKLKMHDYGAGKIH